MNSEYENGPVRADARATADALRAADDAFLFKVLAREVAQRQARLPAHVLGRPGIADRGGSGLHLNLKWCDCRRLPTSINDDATAYDGW